MYKDFHKVIDNIHRDIVGGGKFIDFVKQNQKQFKIAADDINKLDAYKKNYQGNKDEMHILPSYDHSGIQDIYGGSMKDFLTKHKKGFGVSDAIIEKISKLQTDFDMHKGKPIDYDNNVPLAGKGENIDYDNNVPLNKNIVHDKCTCGCSALDIAQKIGGKDIALMVFENQDQLRGLGFFTELNRELETVSKSGSGYIKNKKIKKCNSCDSCKDSMKKMLLGGHFQPKEYRLMGRGWMDSFVDGLVSFGKTLAKPLAAALPGIGTLLTYPMAHLDSVAETLSPGYKYNRGSPEEPQKVVLPKGQLDPATMTDEQRKKFTGPARKSVPLPPVPSASKTGGSKHNKSMKKVKGYPFYEDPNFNTRPIPYVKNENSDYKSYNAGMHNPLNPQPKTSYDPSMKKVGGYSEETYEKLFTKKGLSKKDVENKVKEIMKDLSTPLAINSAIDLYMLENGVSKKEARAVLTKPKAKK